MPVNEMIGWLGSFLFSICALPQVIQTWRTKKAGDLNALFLWFWFWGEVFTLIYIIWADLVQGVYHLPLYFNYVFNLILVVYLIYAKYFYKVNENPA